MLGVKVMSSNQVTDTLPWLGDPPLYSQGTPQALEPTRTSLSDQAAITRMDGGCYDNGVQKSQSLSQALHSNSWLNHSKHRSSCLWAQGGLQTVL